MVDTFESITRRTTRSELSYRVDDKIAEGTASAGSSSTLTDATGLSFRTADFLEGAWIFIHTGTGIGQERYISAQTTGGQVTVVPNWTVTTDNTSQYEVHRKYRVSDYNNVISAALRADREFHLGGRLDISLLSQGILLNPLFTRWANGASSAPDSWTLSGSGAAVSRNADLNRRGPYAAVLTNAVGNSLTFSQAVGRVYKDDTYVLQALIHCSVASRVTIKLNDGVSTASESSTIGAGGWTNVSQSHKMAPTVAIPSLTASVEISSGAAMSAAIAWMYIKESERNRDYLLPSNVNYITKLEVERSNPNTANPDQLSVYDPLVHGDDWEVLAGAVSPTPTLRIHKLVSENKAIGIHGLGYPAIPTNDTDILEINIELCLLKATSLLARDDRSESLYRELKDTTQVYFPANSVTTGRV